MSKKSACKAKLRYESEELAKQAAERAAAFYTAEMKIYHCPICQGWHTTKRSSSSVR
jgi:lipopolysaccharide biosynthesis regulator YciM